MIPGKAADKAGIGPGMKVIAVNDRRLTADRLQDAVAATAKDKQKLRLLVENQEYFKTVTLGYSEGSRYPYLTADTSKTDYLSAIFAAQPSRERIRLHRGRTRSPLFHLFHLTTHPQIETNRDETAASEPFPSWRRVPGTPSLQEKSPAENS